MEDWHTKSQVSHENPMPWPGRPMRNTEMSTLWVVYRMTVRGKTSGVNAVCEQSEWEAMERAQPGYHTLIQAGITNEGEAEQLARSSPVT
jgi:hypothetical protein